MSKSRGFTLIEILIVVAVLAIVGLLGWRVWDAYNQKSADANNTPTASQQPEIKNTADLDKANQTLDNTDVVGNTESELDAETNF